MSKKSKKATMAAIMLSMMFAEDAMTPNPIKAPKPIREPEKLPEPSKPFHNPPKLTKRERKRRNKK